jgi:hypothetical protein
MMALEKDSGCTGGQVILPPSDNESVWHGYVLRHNFPFGYLVVLLQIEAISLRRLPSNVRRRTVHMNTVFARPI